jgi:hypothetical protein
LIENPVTYSVKIEKKIRRILRRGEFIAAVSPEGSCYHDFATIPTIKPPQLLMVRKSIIMADGWLIRIVPTQSFIEFISRQLAGWQPQEPEDYKQLSGFLDALENVVRYFF